MFGLGMPEIVIILVIVLLLFGPSRLPQLGKGLGEAISGLKKGLSASDEAAQKRGIAMIYFGFLGLERST